MLIEKIKKINTTIALTLIICTTFIGVTLLASNQTAYGSNHTARDAVCAGIGAAVGGSETCEEETSGSTIDGTIGTAIDILSGVVGVISVIMVIVGGLKYITSQGDSNGVSSAKNTIIYALVGLAIVALAQTIVKYAIAKISS